MEILIPETNVDKNNQIPEQNTEDVDMLVENKETGESERTMDV